MTTHSSNMQMIRADVTDVMTDVVNRVTWDKVNKLSAKQRGYNVRQIIHPCAQELSAISPAIGQHIIDIAIYSTSIFQRVHNLIKDTIHP